MYCFPHGNASASIYRNWIKTFPPEIEVRPIELPGHGDRYEERPIEDIEEMAERLSQIKKLDLEKPFALYGHSIGGLIAYAWSLYLEKVNTSMPQQLIVGAFTCPSIANPLLKNIKKEFRLNGIHHLPTLEEILDSRNEGLVFKVVNMDMEWQRLVGSRSTYTSIGRGLVSALLPSMVASLRLIDNFDSDFIIVGSQMFSM